MHFESADPTKMKASVNKYIKTKISCKGLNVLHSGITHAVHDDIKNHTSDDCPVELRTQPRENYK